jgi:hypothetical protein
MYHDLKATYWWYGMKRDVIEDVALCDTCQRNKAEHQQPAENVATLASTRVEVGRDCYEFHHGIA